MLSDAALEPGHISFRMPGSCALGNGAAFVACLVANNLAVGATIIQSNNDIDAGSYDNVVRLYTSISAELSHNHFYFTQRAPLSLFSNYLLHPQKSP